MSQHPKKLQLDLAPGGEIDPLDLAQAMANLDYEALSEYVHTLAILVRADAEADVARSRTLLGKRLHATANLLGAASLEIDGAARICKLHEAADAG